MQIGANYSTTSQQIWLRVGMPMCLHVFHKLLIFFVQTSFIVFKKMYFSDTGKQWLAIQL